MTIAARFRLQRGAFVLGVEFEVPSRGVTAVFGPSGSGKTTLLRLIAGLEHDPDGALTVAGEVWQDGGRSLATHRRPLGYVFQEADLFAHLDVRGNLEFGLRRVATAERRVGFDEAVRLLDLRPLLSRRPDGLSGGERQRVAIGRALLTSPRLLLMDEPLAALDAAAKADIVPYLERLHAELQIPVLYVSHAKDEVARLADHLLLLAAGCVVGNGPFLEMTSQLDSPWTQTADAESVIEATIAEHDDRDLITRLEFAGGELLVARANLPIGGRVRVRVLARDVSLALDRPVATSILNCVPARVVEVRDDHAGQSTVRLAIGNDVPLLCRITRRSSRTLALTPGQLLFAQVKSVALLGSFGVSVSKGLNADDPGRE